jgi:hypothetical protein
MVDELIFERGEGLFIRGRLLLDERLRLEEGLSLYPRELLLMLPEDEEIGSLCNESFDDGEFELLLLLLLLLLLENSD